MNALRLTKGVDAELFRERTGLSLDTLASARQQAEQRGLLDTDPTRLVASARGQLFLNDLLHYFLT
jgi:oxygen-independent coproporphyrinogen-3 oxidase